MMDFIQSSQTTLLLQRGGLDLWLSPLLWLCYQRALLLQVTLAVCFVLMFGNSMLLTSFYASSLVSIWVSLNLSGFSRAAFLSEENVSVLLHLCFSFPPPGSRSVEGSILSGVQSRYAQMGTYVGGRKRLHSLHRWLFLR